MKINVRPGVKLPVMLSAFTCTQGGESFSQLSWVHGVATIYKNISAYLASWRQFHTFLGGDSPKTERICGLPNVLKLKIMQVNNLQFPKCNDKQK